MKEKKIRLVNKKRQENSSITLVTLGQQLTSWQVGQSHGCPVLLPSDHFIVFVHVIVFSSSWLVRRRVGPCTLDLAPLLLITPDSINVWRVCKKIFIITSGIEDSFQPFQSKLEGHSHIGYDLSHQERCKVVSRFVAHYTRVAWAVDPVDQGGRG